MPLGRHLECNASALCSFLTPKTKNRKIPTSPQRPGCFVCFDKKKTSTRIQKNVEPRAMVVFVSLR